jgi:SAM-dependent methyltransferase
MTAVSTEKPILLNVGSGRLEANDGDYGLFFNMSEWRQIRIDIDEDVDPDVIADIRRLPFSDNYADGVACFHVLEHIAAMDLGAVLTEFRRVLKPGGRLVIAVPDLQAIGQVLAEDRMDEILYESAGGPIRAHDMLYGVFDGKPHCFHRTGFTPKVLANWVASAGFTGDIGQNYFNIVAMLENGKR